MTDEQHTRLAVLEERMKTLAKDFAQHEKDCSEHRIELRKEQKEVDKKIGKIERTLAKWAIIIALASGSITGVLNQAVTRLFPPEVRVEAKEAK